LSDTSKKQRHVITASEIGQFAYCSFSWYLQRQGLQPDPYLLQRGTAAHEQLGRHVYFYQQTKKKSHWFVAVGLILGITAIFLLLVGWLWI